MLASALRDFPTVRPDSGGDAVACVVQGHSKICEVLEDWTRRHRRESEAYLKEQEVLAGALLAAYRETLREINLPSDVAGGGLSHESRKADLGSVVTSVSDVKLQASGPPPGVPDLTSPVAHAPPTSWGRSSGDKLAHLAQGHTRICALLEDWTQQHRRTFEAHLSEHEHLMHAMLTAQRETLRKIHGLGGGSGVKGLSSKSWTASFESANPAFDDVMLMARVPPFGVPDNTFGTDDLQEKDESSLPPFQIVEGGPSNRQDLECGECSRKTSPSLEAISEKEDTDGRPQTTDSKRRVDVTVGRFSRLIGCAACVTSDLEAMRVDSQMMDWWRRTSGLQTVDKWVPDYHHHPGAWGALLMIQGIPEVTGRLRSKVENYAIYSALFLSMSMQLLANPPESMYELSDAETWSGEWWEDRIQRRVYFFAFVIGTASHMLCILLGMSFVNALNEAARDSDVYRMFSRGRGFNATVKCQRAFRAGCVADFIAVAANLYRYLSLIELVAGGTLVLFVTLRIYTITSNLLYKNSSILSYWRWGKPDADDPYNLDVPAGCFNERARSNRVALQQKPLGQYEDSITSAAGILWKAQTRVTQKIKRSLFGSNAFRSDQAQWAERGTQRLKT